ncbi:MAG: PAS domain S-box protein [Leptolyngbya sp. PLA1]|nr:PAS domain S-box protein [Leptolyngbya sp. PLA1]
MTRGVEGGMVEVDRGRWRAGKGDRLLCPQGGGIWSRTPVERASNCRAWALGVWTCLMLLAGVARAQPLEGREIVVGLPRNYQARGLVVELADGSRDGFARRVMEEVAKATGLKVRFVNLVEEDHVALLEAGEVDVLASISVQDLRLDRVAYSGPLMVARGVALSRKDGPAVGSAQDLVGRRLVVATSGIGHSWSVARGLNVKPCGGVKAAVQEVMAGRGDHVISLEPAIRQVLEQERITGMRLDVIEDAGLSRVFAMGCRKADTALLSELNRGLGIIEDSGVFDDLYAEWVEPYQPRQAPAVVRRDRALRVGALLLGLALLGLATAVVMLVRARRQANAVRASEQRYELLSQAMPGLVLVELRRTGGSRETQWSGRNLAGWQRDFPDTDFADASGEGLRRWVHPEDVERFKAASVAALEEVSRLDIEFRARDAGGADHWIHCVRVPVRHAEGVLWQTVLMDVTELRSTEAALREGEERYRAFVRQSSEGVWRLGLRRPIQSRAGPEEQVEELLEVGYIAECNDAMARAHGYERAEDLIGVPLRSLLPPSVPGNREFLAAFVRSRYRLTNVDSREQTASGELREFSNSLVAELEDGVLQGAWATQRDITDQRVAERALAASEYRLRQVLDNAPNVATQGYDERGRVVFWNRASERLYGWSEAEAVGRELGELILTQAEAESFLAGLAKLDEGSPPEAPVQIQFRRRDGSTGWLLSSLFVIRLADGTKQFVCMDVDITDRVREAEEKVALERRVQQVQRLEGLGTLAGGIAHDFNNLLVGILGGATAARALAPPESDQDHLLATVQAASQRAKDLVTQLLAYAGKSDAPSEPVEVCEVVRGTMRLARTSFGAGVQIRDLIEPGGAWVLASGAQLFQIATNLITNAYESLQGLPGTISVRVCREGLTAGALAQMVGAAEAAEGEYVRIEVADTGKGIPPEEVARVFEPFYSTKPSGRGLGLSAVLGIVRTLGGAIRVESTPGLGTSFCVFLPLTGPGPVRSATTATPTLHGKPGRRVLIVDDEPLVREVATTALRLTGFEVESVESGETAESVVAANPTRFDGVLLDLMMPGIDGLETLKRLRRLNPDLAVVLTSGVPIRGEDGGVLSHPRTWMLPKPFDIDGLVTAIGLAASGVGHDG